MGSKARADPSLPARPQGQVCPGRSECGDARSALKSTAASRIEPFAIRADATPIVDRTIGQMRSAHCAEIFFPSPVSAQDAFAHDERFGIPFGRATLHSAQTRNPAEDLRIEPIL